MPVHFQNAPVNHENRVIYSDCFQMSVEQKTEMEALTEFVPVEFKVLRPVVIWSFTNCRGVDFMAHGEYRIFQAAVPVRYTDGNIEGVYPLVIWENNAYPILGGREEDGMPKVFCDIAPERHYDSHYFTAISLDCETMARFNFFEAEEAPDAEVAQANAASLINAFGYRSIPDVESGRPTWSELILYPQHYYPKKIWHGTGNVEVSAPDVWYRNPGMFRILNGLSGLPNLGFEHAERMLTSIKLCVTDSKSLSRNNVSAKPESCRT